VLQNDKNYFLIARFYQTGTGIEEQGRYEYRPYGYLRSRTGWKPVPPEAPLRGARKFWRRAGKVSLWSVRTTLLPVKS